MVDPGKLPLAQLLDIAQRRNDEAIQTSHGSGRLSDILALLHLEVVAVLIDRLSWLEFLPGCGIVELGPEIGGGEDGIGTLEGGYEGLFVVEVAFDYFNAFGGPGLGFGWVAGYAADFPAGFFRVDICNGATL